MPTYEYGCVDCGHRFTIFASISKHEAGLDTTCPECGSRSAVQIFGSMNFIKSRASGASSSFGAGPVCGPNAGPGCCR